MNYSFEYEKQGITNFLVYKKRKNDELDSITIGMVANQKIDGVIPFVYQQIDQEICFKYNISSMNTLKDYFSGVVSKKRFLTVLKSLVNTFALADEYMLEFSAIVLDQDYIFVDPKTAETSVILIPYKREYTLTIVEFIRALLCSVHYDETEDCSYIAAILSFLNSNQFFDVQEFKLLMDKMLAEKTKGGQQSPGQFVSTKIEVPENAITNKKPEGFHTVEKKIPDTKEKIVETSEDREEDIEDTLKPGEKKKGFFSLKKKETKAKKEEKNKKTLFGKKTGQKDVKQELIMNVPGQEREMKIPQKTASEEKLSVVTTEVKGVKEQDVHLKTNSVILQDFGKTVDLRALSKETEVLIQEKPATEVLNTIPYLLVLRTKEHFELTKERMKIGSDAIQNDFCISGNTAVSRAHAVFYYIDNKVYVEDNFSTNGTIIDGERLKPGIRSKEISHASIICLGDEELELKMY